MKPDLTKILADRFSDKDEVGNRLSEILKTRQFSQTEFAEMSGVSLSLISKICTQNRRHVSLPIAMKIAKTLDLEINQIFFLHEKKAH